MRHPSLVYPIHIHNFLYYIIVIILLYYIYVLFIYLFRLKIQSAEQLYRMAEQFSYSRGENGQNKIKGLTPFVNIHNSN
jgi:hypothetical protein